MACAVLLQIFPCVVCTGDMMRSSLLSSKNVETESGLFTPEVVQTILTLAEDLELSLFKYWGFREVG